MADNLKEYRADDKHNTLLFRYDDQGLAIWNKSKREEKYISIDDLKELIEEN